MVGGTSIMGDVGAIWRTALGVLFVAMINNGFTLLGLDSTYEQMVQGRLAHSAGCRSGRVVEEGPMTVASRAHARTT